MYKFTLSLILNEDMTHVLMCEHKKFNKLNFIGGKIELNETVEKASLREIFEETGIRSGDLYGFIVFRHQIVELLNNPKKEAQVYPDFDMYISIGILDEPVKLKEEKNPLVWVDINDTQTLINANGDGQCYTFLKEGLEVLRNHGYEGVPVL